MKFERLDRKSLYQSYEQTALEEAAKATDPRVRASWELAADSWRILAGLVPERCFCRRDAIRAKHYAGGARMAFYEEHLREAIVQEVERRIALKSKNWLQGEAG